MKTKSKEFTKLFLFCISILILSCEKDNILFPENHLSESNKSIAQNDIHIETLPYEGFTKLLIYNKIDKFLNFENVSRNTDLKKNHKFKIHKDFYKKITKLDSDYTSYTFLISDTEQDEINGVQNLVINETKNKIEVFILSYHNINLTETDKYSIKENLIIEKIFNFDESELGNM